MEGQDAASLGAQQTDPTINRFTAKTATAIGIAHDHKIPARTEKERAVKGNSAKRDNATSDVFNRDQLESPESDESSILDIENAV